jgi:hypothetical protein
MIGGTLEYLMSSLPDLSFQNSDEVRQRVTGLLKKYAGPGGEELSPAEILDGEAQKFLPASVFYIFQKIDLKNIHEAEFQKNNSKVLAAYSTFIFQLKKEIKTWRTSQNESDKKAAKNKLENIIGDGTPLEKEIQLMKYQWHKLEEFSAGHFADREALFAYKIKLLILLRWWSFDAEKGFKKFTKMTAKN